MTAEGHRGSEAGEKAATVGQFYSSATPKLTREARAPAMGKNCPKTFPRHTPVPGDKVLLLVPNPGPWHKEG